MEKFKPNIYVAGSSGFTKFNPKIVKTPLIKQPRNIDLYIDNINTKSFDSWDKKILLLSSNEYESIKSKVKDGYYRGFKLKIESRTKHGLIWKDVQCFK